MLWRKEREECCLKERFESLFRKLDPTLAARFFYWPHGLELVNFVVSSWIIEL